MSTDNNLLNTYNKEAHARLLIALATFIKLLPEMGNIQEADRQKIIETTKNHAIGLKQPDTTIPDDIIGTLPAMAQDMGGLLSFFDTIDKDTPLITEARIAAAKPWLTVVNFNASLDALDKVLQMNSTHPDEEKYKGIRMQAREISTMLWPVQVFMQKNEAIIRETKDTHMAKHSPGAILSVAEAQSIVDNNRTKN